MDCESGGLSPRYSITEADLFAAAASSDAEKQVGQNCEACFFAGMKRLICGDKQAAADYWQMPGDAKKVYNRISNGPGTVEGDREIEADAQAATGTP